MVQTFFGRMFDNLQTPVIVFASGEKRFIAYANSSMKLRLNPMLTIENLKNKTENYDMSGFFRFSDTHQNDAFWQRLLRTGSITNFKATLCTFEESELPVILSANMVEFQNESYYIVYMDEDIDDDTHEQTNERIESTAFHLAYDIYDTDEAINKILGLVGSNVHVSRAYIFEEISPEMTRNTYEWCAPGVEPAIQDLQNLAKSDYNYDVIVNGGMYITDDIRDLPENDRDILAAQGIKSLAILPLRHHDKALGYVGFDDTVNYRKWSRQEIHLLEEIANILVSPLIRRNSELQTARSFNTLQKVTDNIDAIIYVSDIKTFELVFVNKKLAETFNVHPSELLGKKCWQVLQKDKDEPCEFCPLNKMLNSHGEIITDTYSWEQCNTITNKWYLSRDTIFEWIDGSMVHMETATEITDQKEYEEKLKVLTSTDMLTKVYNRSAGYKYMQDILSEIFHKPNTVSLAFIDLDGLKFTNDTYGHDEGDKMIIETVKVIQSQIRETDMIFRWGGDEFILLLRCSLKWAEQILANISKKAEELNKTSKEHYKIKFSYGITDLFLDDEHTTIDMLISEADKKMYEQKMHKRSCD